MTGKYFSYNLHTSFPHIRNLFSSMNTILHNLWNGSSSYRCRSRNSLIGFHPNSDRRADFGKLIIVFKIFFPSWYCKLAIADGTHTAQPCPIEGRIIEVHNEFPNEIRLKLPCSPKFVSYKLVFSGHFPFWMFLYDK